MNRIFSAALLLGVLPLNACDGCAGLRGPTGGATLKDQSKSSFIGFDRNDYPGDGRLGDLRKHFAFSGYWLNNPPGENANSWAGHRQKLHDAGFGFLVLWNGRLDAQIKASKISPEDQGKQDAASAIAAARTEGFPDNTIIFLDQEEGGRLLPEQSSYFFGFTETVSASNYRAGSYLSGEPSPEGHDEHGNPVTISTAEDVRETSSSKHLHPVSLWVSQDSCPPAPGCTVAPGVMKKLTPKSSGIMDASVWQYAQSPRRLDRTKSCAATYAKDGQCYAGVSSDLFLDLNLADSPDPSHGR